MKGFSKSTLEGNWYEDRAPELGRGVFGDYGYREMGTSAKAHFRDPRKHREQAGVNKRRLRFGMLTHDTLKEAQAAYGGGTNVGAHFGATIATHGGAHDKNKRFLGTSYGAAFGAPEKAKPTHFEAMAARSALQPSAGGPGARRPERGMKSSGTVGERYLTDVPPGQQTAVQRSWLPSADPGISVRRAQAAGGGGGRAAQPAPDTNHMSLQIGGENGGVVRAPRGAPGGRTAPWRAPGRKQLITGGPESKPGIRIFNDDP